MAEEMGWAPATGWRARLARTPGARRTLPELRDELFLDLGEVARKQSRFWVLLLLSATIATAGILVDSTATVIGAMIVAPLGTPIMGMALAVVTGEGRRFWGAAAMVIAGAVTVISLAALLSWLLPELQALSTNGQITGRTAPGVIDLIAAVATGFAGAYGLARKDVSDVMPGVAIAISLVPPLAVVGITAAAGDWRSAWGAFLLFASNVVAMIVAGTILFTVYGYHREARAAAGFRRKSAYLAIAAALVLILVPLAITTGQTAREQVWLTRASAAAGPWAGSRGYTVSDVRFDGSVLYVTIEGTGTLPAGAQLLSLLRGQLPTGMPVVVETIEGTKLPIGQVPA
jgi:uncharacterized hydrophobic protein (TIGR00271 family)